jgi:hypothetical protein
MAINIIGTAANITRAINTFDAQYHEGFDIVRRLGDQYLDAALPIPETVNTLISNLRRVLGEYGAAEEGVDNYGALNAPTLATLEAFADAFKAADLHADLKRLRDWKLPLLRVLDNTRSINRGFLNNNVLQFDQTLIQTLNSLANDLFHFVNNRTVTYPMKAVLLVTGFMPAFDGQVRRGLTDSGLGGFGAPQMLPPTPHPANGQKITRLPFLLGECWNSHLDVLTEGIGNSYHPELFGEPGRIFDILLFVQGRRNNPIRTVEFEGDRDNWYTFA